MFMIFHYLILSTSHFLKRERFSGSDAHFARWPLPRVSTFEGMSDNYRLLVTHGTYVLASRVGNRNVAGNGGRNKR